MEEPEILLTNDDGIESTGFHALYDALEAVGSVTAVAPADNQSAVGRALSHSVTVRDHELGYVIEGTPSDCVIAGLSTLVPEADVVVAGCNRGANLGTAVLGRSGTVSAAVEAAFLDVPAIAVSVYIPVESFTFDEDTLAAHQYAEATRVTQYLVDGGLETDLFGDGGYLNVNAPIADRATGEMVVTRPAERYYMGAEREADTVKLQDEVWKRFRNGNIEDPPGTDRRAIFENKVSVSPLVAPHETANHEGIDALAATYPQLQKAGAGATEQ
jgi:5'-nucleotidase